MTTFIYLHGFNSASTDANPKIAALKKIGDVIPISYISVGSRDQAYMSISRRLPEDFLDLLERDQVIFVGTSLGAYWAARFARTFQTGSILINPCVDPFESLAKYAGKEFTNYVTGEVREFSFDAHESYEGAYIPRTLFRLRPLMLLAMDDEVIDSKETLRNFEPYYVHRTFETGGHQFDRVDDLVAEAEKYANWTELN